MAHVANCPQCNHDLLVPDETDHESWAKCPECRAYFQVNQATLRELPALLLVESPSHEPGTESPIVVADAKADVEPEPPQTGNNLQDTAERIDQWFRSAQTVSDAQHKPASGTPDAPGTDLPNADAPSAPWAEESPSTAMFDDAQHMDELLADIAKPTTGKQADKRAEDKTSAVIAATEAADLPVFSKPVGGQRRRKRSLVRGLAAIVIAGVIGSGLGYYALLWLRGASGDFLDVAQYLPQMMLPAEMRAKPQLLPAAAPITVDAQAEQAQTAEADPGEPAERQATYTTTDEPAAPKSRSVDDRYGLDTTDSPTAAEPEPLQDPEAAPLADRSGLTETVPLANAPSFTAEELAAALQAAQEAQPSLVAGKLEDGREVQRAKGYSYSLLADLAQKATFVDVSSNSESAAASQQAAEKLFRATLSDAATRGEVAVILPKWTASPHRKHGGVFFAAKLTDPKHAGTIIEYRAALDSGQSLTLLVPTDLAGQVEVSSRPLAVIGWIVDEPSDQVTGYTGQAQQAVLVSRLIPLE